MLRVENIEAHYGASQALFGVHLEVSPGEVVTLMGRNGMGKTTSVHCIMGIVPTSAGRITWEDQIITNLPSHRIAQAGIGLVPEGRQVFPNLSVIENLVAAARSGTGHAQGWDVERVFQMFPALAARRDGLGNLLSGGEQQMLAIGRALMTQPKLLLLDELSLGLMPRMVDDCYIALQQLQREGMTILLVEQNTQKALAVADEVSVLESGSVAWQGTAEEARQDSSIIEAYIGLRR